MCVSLSQSRPKACYNRQFKRVIGAPAKVYDWTVKESTRDRYERERERERETDINMTSVHSTGMKKIFVPVTYIMVTYWQIIHQTEYEHLSESLLVWVMLSCVISICRILCWVSDQVICLIQWGVLLYIVTFPVGSKIITYHSPIILPVFLVFYDFSFSIIGQKLQITPGGLST